MRCFLCSLCVISLSCLAAPVVGAPTHSEEPAPQGAAPHVASSAHDASASHGTPNPLDLRYDTAIWAIVIFAALLLILRAKAWGPILEGLQKREEMIRSSLEEARKTRVEMEQMRQQFRQELSEAHQQIPHLMEEARKKAEAITAEMVAKTSALLQADRERLRREMEIAKDQALKELWEQAAQLATLISAKAIGRSLSEEDHRRLIDESLQEMRQATSN